MKTSLLVLCVVVGAACTRHETKPDAVSHVSAPLPLAGKRAAPVAIDADLSEGRAKLTLTFDRAGQDVSVRVSGVDGLEVAAKEPLLAGAKVERGERQSFDVAFTRGAGRSHLVVSVTGHFDGAPLDRVVTFALGEGPLQQTGTKLILNDGDALKVMPVQP